MITFSFFLSRPPFRCYTKGLPFNPQPAKSQNCKIAIQCQGINVIKLGIKKTPKLLAF